MDAVTKIFLGSRISPADEHRVLDAASTLGVTVAKMTVDTYSLQFRTVARGKKG